MDLPIPCILKGPMTLDRPSWKSPKRAARQRTRGTIDVRFELISRIRQQIADGTYDTPERLEAAIDQMAQQLHLG